MKNNKVPLSMIVAAAMLGLAQENAAAGNVSDFTPLENLNALERIAIQTKFESEYPSRTLNWEQTLVGLNANGEIEIRDRNSFELQAVGAPTCADATKN